MSIASRIQAIEQHLTDDYNVLEVAGADLTNVNKNILNLKSTWQERLLYFINNGTDVVWNNWDKATGEGTILTLNNTEEAPMKIDLKGNTSQEGTPTPETPQDIHVVSGDNTIKVEGKNLCNGINQGYFLNQSISFCGYNSGDNGLAIKVNGGNYTISTTETQTRYRVACANELPPNTSTTVNTYNGVNKDSTNDSITIDTTGHNYLVVNATDLTKIQIEKGSTATTYEPYVSSSYQVNLPIENILDITSSGSSIGGVPFTIENGIIKINGTTSSSTASYYFNTFRTKSESAMFSIEATGYTDKSSGNSALILQQSDDGTTGWSTLSELSLNSIYAKQNSVTLDSSKYYRLRWYVDNNTFTNATIKAQLEYGNKKNSYTPYGTTPIELCKIGTYQDRFIRNSGKNLIDTLNGTIVKRESAGYSNLVRTDTTLSYSITTSVAGYLGFVIPIEVGKQYTLSFNLTKGVIQTIELDSEISEVGTNYGGPKTSGYSFTATKPYVGIWIIANTDGGSQASVSNLMLEEGSSATDYEPYGTSWYLKKEIGKYTFTGNETLEEYSGAGAKKITNMIVAHTFESNATPLGYSNISAMKPRASIYTLSAEGLSYSNNEIYLYFANKTSQEILNILKNTDLYYLLASPYLSLIESETLIEQLNALAKSYEGQTNITQVNNDSPFIINATALREMS